jgi:hypothetical protein
MIDMDSHWFSTLFEGDYDDVLNNIADYVNYGNSSVNDGDCSGNYSSDTDDDDDDDNDDSDEEDELFWEREFDDQKLILCTAGAATFYYNTYIYKEPCMDSYNIGMQWLIEILHGHWTRYVNMFRMDATTFQSLCFILENQYGLKASRRMCVFEKVGIFLYTIALGASNREVQERFQHSGETISRYFNEVLRSVCSLATDLIQPADSGFVNTPREIVNNPRYMPHFKVMSYIVFVNGDSYFMNL